MPVAMRAAVAPPTEKEKEVARDVASALVAPHAHVTVTVEEFPIGIPEALVNPLLEASRLVAEGHPVAVLALDDPDEISAKEAADILKVSRPYLLNLLKKGVLPYRMVGSHHRIPMSAVIVYKQDQAPRRRALEALTAETQERGR
jgi:excisionase family DNA binding protein